jgi:hypothetical protein
MDQDDRGGQRAQDRKGPDMADAVDEAGPEKATADSR